MNSTKCMFRRKVNHFLINLYDQTVHLWCFSPKHIVCQFLNKVNHLATKVGPPSWEGCVTALWRPWDVILRCPGVGISWKPLVTTCGHRPQIWKLCEREEKANFPFSVWNEENVRKMIVLSQEICGSRSDVFCLGNF